MLICIQPSRVNTYIMMKKYKNIFELLSTFGLKSAL